MVAWTPIKAEVAFGVLTKLPSSIWSLVIPELNYSLFITGRDRESFDRGLIRSVRT